MVHYEPQRDKPQLTFLTPRYEASQLPLNLYEIQKKKERDLSKVQAVIHYVQHQQQCRTLLLLDYFNEEGGEPCGLCDVCVRKRKQDTVHESDTQLRQDIVLHLQQHGPLAPRPLSQAFGTIPEKQLLHTVRYLIEQEILVYDQIGKLALNPRHPP